MRKIIPIVLAVILLFPLWMMIQGSFQPLLSFGMMPPKIFPTRPVLDNYKIALGGANVLVWIGNTLLIVGASIVLGVAVNGAAGYVFATARFKWKEIIFWLVMSATFVSRYTLLVSQYVIVRKLSIPPLAAVVGMTVFWPIGIFLFRNAFKAIPSSLIETARIDGASEIRIFFRIVLPLSLPIVGFAIVNIGVAALGDFIWQKLLLQTENELTFIVGLMMTAQNNKISIVMPQHGVSFAVATLIAFPLMLIFMLGSKYFIGGLTSDSVKE